MHWVTPSVALTAAAGAAVAWRLNVCGAWGTKLALRHARFVTCHFEDRRRRPPSLVCHHVPERTCCLARVADGTRLFYLTMCECVATCEAPNEAAQG